MSNPEMLLAEPVALPSRTDISKHGLLCASTIFEAAIPITPLCQFSPSMIMILSFVRLSSFSTLSFASFTCCSSSFCLSALCSLSVLAVSKASSMLSLIRRSNPIFAKAILPAALSLGAKLNEILAVLISFLSKPETFIRASMPVRGFEDIF